MAKLITAAQFKILYKNHKTYEKNPDFDPKPVLKIFNPEGSATWLITDGEPTTDGKDWFLSGLMDLGFGNPELGSVMLSELQSVRSKRLRLPLERDLWFVADKTISKYAEEARGAGQIIA